MGFFRDPDPDPEIPGIFKIPIPGIFFQKSRNPRDRDGKFSGSRKNPERISKHINYDIMHSQISQKSRKYPEKSQKIFCIHAFTNPEKFRKIPKHILHTCIEKSRKKIPRFSIFIFFSIFSISLFQPENLKAPKIPRRMINK